MFWKLSIVVLSFALCGAWLLTLRHNRIQAMSELTQAQLRINKQDEKLWVLRSRIAARVTPAQVERLCAEIGPLHPILPYTSAGDMTIAMESGDPPVPLSASFVGPPKPAKAVKPGSRPATGANKAKSVDRRDNADQTAPKPIKSTKPAEPARVASNQPAPKPR